MTPVREVPSSDFERVRAALAGEYEILRELGRGGMAAVYRAREVRLGREVAIKVLPASSNRDADFVERFEREARTSARLEHPHIVPIHRVGRRGDIIYFVMKLLSGPPLANRLLAEGTLGAAAVRRLLIEAGSALGYAHGQGVVHRDIKPDNIMLDDGRCVLTDFGIARSESDVKLTATGTTVGTPLYMSPEQGRGLETDARSDIYSLGVVAYECLTGAPPFAGENAVAVMMQHIQAPLPRPKLATDDERALFAIIERMLAKAPAHRYQSAEELIVAVAGTRAATGAGTRTTSDVPPTRFASPEAPTVLSKATVRRLARLRTIAAQLLIVVAASVGLYWSLHFAIMHRSRCPTPEMGVQQAGAPADASGAQPAFTVMVDAVGAISRGSNLDVYYDVCGSGLEAGVPLTTRIAVSKKESGLKRFFAPVLPVIVSYDEKTGGPATRRHRTLDVAQMPAGSYTLDLSVIDEQGQQRERSVDFQITGR